MSRYPTRFLEIDAWSRENGVSRDEASRRFIQYVILAAFAQSRSLRESLVFKGGNALDFVWQPNRSTLDLDFSIDHHDLLFRADTDDIRAHVGRAVDAFQQQSGVILRSRACASVRQARIARSQPSLYESDTRSRISSPYGNGWWMAE